MRAKILLFTFLFLFDIIGQSTAKEINCEKSDSKMRHNNRFSKTCWMNVKTIIGTPGFTIRNIDSEVFELNFSGNKKVKFLPDYVYRSYRNLVEYFADECELRKVSKKNFKRLAKLKRLSLSSNQITSIPSNSFEDLIQLESLDLSDNQIKLVNGKAFEKLYQFIQVKLNGNECIDQKFVDRAALVEVVSEKCSFTEVETEYEQNDEIEIDERLPTSSELFYYKLRTRLPAIGKFNPPAKLSNLNLTRALNPPEKKSSEICTFTADGCTCRESST